MSQLNDPIQIEFLGKDQLRILSQKPNILNDAAQEVVPAKRLSRGDDLRQKMEERNNTILLPKKSTVGVLEDLCLAALSLSTQKTTGLK